MLNNIDPTAPSGGLPSEVKQAFKPEVGFEFFYLLASEEVYPNVFYYEGLKPALEAKIAWDAAGFLVHTAYGEMLRSIKREEAVTPRLIHIIATLLCIHSLKFGNTQDFFSQVLASDPLPKETSEDRRALGQLIMNTAEEEVTPVQYAVRLLNLFIQSGRIEKFFAGVAKDAEALNNVEKEES